MSKQAAFPTITDDVGHLEECRYCFLQDWQGHATRFTMGGIKHSAPTIWINGRSTHYEQTGATPLEAMHTALADWTFGCEMERFVNV